MLFYDLSERGIEVFQVYVQLIVISAQLFFLLLQNLVNCQHVRTVTEFGGSSLKSPQAFLHKEAVREGEYFQEALFVLPS